MFNNCGVSENKKVEKLAKYQPRSAAGASHLEFAVVAVLRGSRPQVVMFHTPSGLLQKCCVGSISGRAFEKLGATVLLDKVLNQEELVFKMPEDHVALYQTLVRDVLVI